jgi:hypothetical protein
LFTLVKLGKSIKLLAGIEAGTEGFGQDRNLLTARGIALN